MDSKFNGGAPLVRGWHQFQARWKAWFLSESASNSYSMADFSLKIHSRSTLPLTPILWTLPTLSYGGPNHGPPLVPNISMHSTYIRDFLSSEIMHWRYHTDISVLYCFIMREGLSLWNPSTIVYLYCATHTTTSAPFRFLNSSRFMWLWLFISRLNSGS